MFPAGKSTAQAFSRTDFVLVALWWGLVAGLGEGIAAWYAQSYIWHDLLRAAVMVEPILFVAVPLLVLAVDRGRLITRAELMRATLLFCALALFDWMSRATPWVSPIVA